MSFTSSYLWHGGDTHAVKASVGSAVPGTILNVVKWHVFRLELNFIVQREKYI